MKPSKDTERLEDALEHAEDMYWSAIAADYPEAITGDLDPMLAIEFANATRRAVVGWLEVNADKKLPEKKSVTILLHNIEYSYNDPDMNLDSCDEEQIAYEISNDGNSDGFLRDKNNDVIIGSWAINNK